MHLIRVGCPQSHTGQGFSSCVFSCQRAKKSIVLGHFSFQFELWFFLIWSWSIPVGASETRCSTRVFAVSKTAATDHSRHESTKCEQDSKSVVPHGTVGSNPTRSTIQFVLEPNSLRKRVRVRFLFIGGSAEGLLGTVNEQRQGIIMAMVSCLLFCGIKFALCELGQPPIWLTGGNRCVRAYRESVYTSGTV